jgi:hypothetical protein
MGGGVLISPRHDAYAKAFDAKVWRQCLAEAANKFGPSLSDLLAPTPLFLPRWLSAEMDAIAQDIFACLLSGDPRLPGDEIVPQVWRFTDNSKAPALLNVDFALTRLPSGRVAPRVLELQGFASYYFSQIYLSQLYARMMPGTRPEAAFLGGMNAASYSVLLRKIILGGCDPDEVVLVDIEPEKQKNWMEFQLTARHCGIRVVCLSQIKQVGRDLRVREGRRWVPVRRIYSRLVPEEVAERGIDLPWCGRRPPAVSWVVNPGWFFRWSKAVLPMIRHEGVPASARLDRIPDPDLTEKVLKPLFSFGGRGVHLAPDRDDLERIPDAEKHLWLLMDKVYPASLAKDPESGEPLLGEVRLLYVHHEGRFLPVTTMVRMGRKSGQISTRHGLGCWAKVTTAFVEAA